MLGFASLFRPTRLTEEWMAELREGEQLSDRSAEECSQGRFSTPCDK